MIGDLVDQNSEHQRDVRSEVKIVSRRRLGNLHLEISDRQFKTQFCGQVFMPRSSKVRMFLDHPHRCFAKQS